MMKKHKLYIFVCVMRLRLTAIILRQIRSLTPSSNMGAWGAELAGADDLLNFQDVVKSNGWGIK
jgi:hypothetical protein